MDRPDLDELCAYWQKELRLQDWDVRIGYYRSYDMPLYNGLCSAMPTTKTAVIKIMDPVDHNERTLWPFDVEQVVVHELLHLHGKGCEWPADTPQDVAQEQMIDLTAEALVRLKRGAATTQSKKVKRAA